MKVAAPAFAKFAGLIRLSAMDVSGKRSDELLEQMQQKVRMLGNATVTVHELHAGFDRFGGQLRGVRLRLRGRGNDELKDFAGGQSPGLLVGGPGRDRCVGDKQDTFLG